VREVIGESSPEEEDRPATWGKHGEDAGADEGGGVRADEDMTPSDTTIDYKVRSFLHLHSNFGYNSLGSTCTCRYLNVDTDVSQSASPSKLNFRFVGSPIVFH
jgi:hypothetical protein